MNAPVSPTFRPTERARFNAAVHGLRAIATLMVFGCHMLDSFQTYFFPSSAFLGAVMPFVKRFGTFGVELFFVISGYVIMASVGRYSTGEFVLRRFVRIYPLFAFFTLVFFALNGITHLYPDKLSLAALVFNLSFADIYFGTQALSPNAWSLTYEANFYAMAALACWLFRRRPAVAAVAVAIMATAFLARFPIASYFVAGCICYFLRGRQASRAGNALQVAVILVWCACASIIDRNPGVLDASAVAANLALLAVTSLFFFVASSPASVLDRIGSLPAMGFIGTISYSFYLTHPYAYLPLRLGFQKLGLGDWNIGAAALIYFPVMTAIAIGASYVVHRLLEVGPYRVVFGEAVYKEGPTKTNALVAQGVGEHADNGPAGERSWKW